MKRPQSLVAAEFVCDCGSLGSVLCPFFLVQGAELQNMLWGLLACLTWTMSVSDGQCVSSHGQCVSHMDNVRLGWAVCVSHGQCASHKGSVCLTWAMCVSQGQCVYQMGSVCLTRAVCVSQGQCVSHKGNACLTRAECVSHRQYVSYKGRVCLTWAVCVSHRQSTVCDRPRRYKWTRSNQLPVSSRNWSCNYKGNLAVF